MTQNTNNTSLEDRILDNFGGAIENDLIHTIGSADEQLDELNTMTRSSYIDTADLKDSLASTKDKFTVFSLNVQSINSTFKLIYPLYMLELNNADFFSVQSVYKKVGSPTTLTYHNTSYRITISFIKGKNVQATEVY